MTCRTAERIVTWALLATAACSGDNTGPSAPTCSSALASQLTLAVGASASSAPPTDGGCVGFPANASAVDSAECLFVPQSAAPTFGLSSPFALRAATLGAASMRPAQTLAQSAGPPTPAGQFDGLLRRLGSEHAARAGAAAPRPLPAAPRLLPAAARSEEHTSELQSQSNLVCRLLLETKTPSLWQPKRFAPSPPPFLEIKHLWTHDTFTITRLTPSTVRQPIPTRTSPCRTAFSLPRH